MGFDVQSARKAGYSDEEILQHLTSTRKFDVDGAMKAGYSRSEIIDHLAQGKANKPAAETPKPVNAAPPPKSFGEQVKEFTSGLWNSVNPIPGLKSLVTHPNDTLAAIAQGQAYTKQAAKDSWNRGDYITAAAKGLYSQIPLIGPALSKAGNEMASGNYGRGLGESTGIGLTLAGPKVLPKVLPKEIPILPKLITKNPAEASAVRFALKRQIPLDAGTVTGNWAVRGLQWLADRSILGSEIAKRAKQTEANAFARVGRELAEESNAYNTSMGKVPGAPVVPEQAGASLRDTLNQKVGKLKADADILYGKFREIEGRPENLKTVQIKRNTIPATVKISGEKVKVSELSPEVRKALGYGDLEPEVIQMVEDSTNSRMAEMKDVFSSDIGKLSGKGKKIEGIEDMNYESSVDQKGGYGHIPVKRAFPEVSDMKESPGQIADAIERDQGNPIYQEVKRRVALDVRDRFQPEIENANLSAKEGKALQPQAPQMPEANPAYKTEVELKQIPLPVDMRTIKMAAKPLYAHMSKWMPNALRNASQGYTALKGIVEGDDWIQASVAEAGLSGLKSLAREAVGPDLANVSQGIGKFSTKILQNEIDRTVAAAGPDAIQALRAGRAKHLLKMRTADVLKKLREEPVEAFQQMVYAKDAGVGLLRKVAQEAPSEMPKIGRAYLEDLLKEATTGGAFEKTQTIWSKWQHLGPETKRVVFKDKSHIQNLDDFFLAAKKAAENPNTSGSGFTAALSAQGGLIWFDPINGISLQIGAASLAKLLRNPTTVKILANGLKAPLSNKFASAMAAHQIMGVAGQLAEPVKQNLFQQKKDLWKQQQGY